MGERIAAEGTAELRAALRLSLVRGIGPLLTRRLLDRFGDAAGVLRAEPSELRCVPGVGGELATRIRQSDSIDVDAELAECREHGIAVLRPGEEGYPARLLEIHDAPQILYARGQLELAEGLAVAIVGTRQPSLYGLRQAERLARGLAAAGVTVVSGLARGIDGAAHRGALAAGGRTVAVLGSGLRSVYPPEHVGLADEIVGQGLLYSEAPVRQAPRSGAFPQRNRLISGLSVAVVVVEASGRSGALITARHAAEQGREVLAVPGRVDQPNARGCHRLIKDGAKLVECVDDVLDELGPLSVPARVADHPRSVTHPAELKLNPLERAVFDQITGEPLAIDRLIAACGLPVAQVLSVLTLLEMRQLIRRTGGATVARRHA